MTKKLDIIIVLSFFLCLGNTAQSQSLAKRYVNNLLNDTSDISRPQFLVYPSLSFAPETSWEIGLSSLYIYYAKRDTSNRLSEINGFTFVTLENQYGIWFDHAIYADQSKWFFLGRLRLQSFPLKYYGIGMDSPSEYLSLVDANQILIKERVLRKVGKNLFFGLEIDFQRFSQTNFKLAKDIPSFDMPRGSSGSSNLGFGAGLVYDDRHNVLNVVSASADELIQKLELEGANSPADVLITVDAGRLNRAVEKDLLQVIESETLHTNIPSKYRAPDNKWFGLTYRARVFAYSKERVDPFELSTYEALTQERWKGRILTRSSENIYNQSLLASIVAHHGQEAATEWASALLANMARNPKGSDRDQIKAVASGEGDVAIVNTYYVGIMLNDSNEEERKAAEKIAIFFPNQDDRGTHINVSGAAVTKNAPNKDNAIALIEFLSEVDSQNFLANINFEYPVNPNAVFSDLLKEWGSFKADEINLSELGKKNRDAVVIFDRVGWK